jgi:hypothetical protein
MANYTFYNKTTKKESIISMPISELDSFKEANPHLEQQFTTPNIADPTRLGLHKPDSGFRDVLKRIKSASGKRSNTINTW